MEAIREINTYAKGIVVKDSLENEIVGKYEDPINVVCPWNMFTQIKNETVKVGSFATQMYDAIKDTDMPDKEIKEFDFSGKKIKTITIGDEVYVSYSSEISKN
jgi:hypothetical protein